MSNPQPTLHLLCGKIASGKSTLANELAKAVDTVLICEDLWLAHLYPDNIKSVALTMPFMRTSARKFPFAKGLMYAITHLQQLESGINRMCFAGSLRHLIEQNNAECALLRLCGFNSTGNLVVKLYNSTI